VIPSKSSWKTNTERKAFQLSWCSETHYRGISHQQSCSCLCFWKDRTCTRGECSNLKMSCPSSRCVVKKALSLRKPISVLLTEVGQKLGFVHIVVHDGVNLW